MMTEQELDDRINKILDEDYPGMCERMEQVSITEGIRKAILSFEIDQLRETLEKAVGNIER